MNKEEILNEIKKKVIGIRMLLVEENDIKIFFRDSVEAISITEFNSNSLTRKILELSRELSIGLYNI